MDILVVIIFILLVLVILVLYGMQITYSHDALMTSAHSIKKRIRTERSNRYLIGKTLLADWSDDVQASSLLSSLEEYPNIKKERDEVKWERSWLPKMKAFINRHHDDTADEFISNEMDLSADRETLASLESDLMKMESNKFQMSLIHLFAVIADKTGVWSKKASKTIAQGKSRMAQLSQDMQEREQIDMQRDANVTHYGGRTYFSDMQPSVKSSDAQPRQAKKQTQQAKHSARNEARWNG